MARLQWLTTWTWIGALVLTLGANRASAATGFEGVSACTGDCDASGQTTVDEILKLVNIALGNASVLDCGAGDLDHNGQITVDEILAAVNAALNGCAPAPTSTPTWTVTPSFSPTPTATPTSQQAGLVAEAVKRDIQGQAIHAGQTMTVEGVVTVSAGVFANNRLKVFVQDGGAGILVYADSATSFPIFQEGDQLQATGVIGQLDTTEGVENGTVFVNIGAGSWAVLSSNNPLPAPMVVHLSDIAASSGTAYVGTLVSVANVQKVSGNWPALGSKSTAVTVSDGTAQLPLKFQKNAISGDMVNKLNSIGTGPFNLVGIVIQNAPTTTNLLTGFEIWVRDAGDINP